METKSMYETSGNGLIRSFQKAATTKTTKKERKLLNVEKGNKDVHTTTLNLEILFCPILPTHTHSIV